MLYYKAFDYNIKCMHKRKVAMLSTVNNPTESYVSCVNCRYISGLSDFSNWTQLLLYNKPTK